MRPAHFGDDHTVFRAGHPEHRRGQVDHDLAQVQGAPPARPAALVVARASHAALRAPRFGPPVGAHLGGQHQPALRRVVDDVEVFDDSLLDSDQPSN